MYRLLLVFIFCLPAFVYAQNLVPNPSFEEYVTCPTLQNQVNYAIGWQGYGDTPDYFNACSQTFSVPYNWGGYQQAASGNAYCGIGTFVGQAFGLNLREFLVGQLITALEPGTKYYVSVKASLSISSQILANCASNHLGLKVSSIPSTLFNEIPPQIYFDSLIVDTAGWKRIFGSFIADSAYNYIGIGNFFDDWNTDTLILGSFSDYCFSYYYVDDVCLSTDSLFASNYNYTGVEDLYDRHLVIYPNPTQDYINLEFTGLSYPISVKISNPLGQELYRKENFKNNKIQIDLTEMANTILLISIQTGNTTFYSKILKQ